MKTYFSLSPSPYKLLNCLKIVLLPDPLGPNESNQLCTHLMNEHEHIKYISVDKNCMSVFHASKNKDACNPLVVLLEYINTLALSSRAV